MCVAAIAWQAHRDWLLVAVGNRDEFHARDAAPLAAWDDGSGILAGRDLKSGGTWLGVTDHRFALVTNLRGGSGPDPGKVSRGRLVGDLLTGSGEYGDPETAALADFNPFNLFLADADQARFLSHGAGDARALLAHGIYGLSNGPLDGPWPKTLQLKAALGDWLIAGSADIAPLFAALAEERLPTLGFSTAGPSDVAAEPPQTPVFIRNATYGTRCSTVVTIDRQGRGRIVERRFDSAAQPTGETALSFAWALG
jgi:uncharacterized protein with NRDE domain